MNDLTLTEVLLVAVFTVVLCGLVGALRALIDWFTGGKR